MAKRFSTTQIDQPVKKWNVRLEAPAVYVVAGVSPNKLFLLRANIDKSTPTWLSMRARFFYGDIIHVSGYEAVEMPEPTKLEANNVKCGGEAKEWVFDSESAKSRVDGHAFIAKVRGSNNNRGHAKEIVIADPMKEKEIGVKGTTIMQEVWSSNPTEGNVVSVSYGKQVLFWSAQRSIIRIPAEQAKLYTLASEFELQNEMDYKVYTIGALDWRPTPGVSLWLNSGMQYSRGAESLILAAGTFHDTNVKRLTEGRTFKSKMEVSKEETFIRIKATANIDEKTSSRSKASLIRAHQQGEFICVKFTQGQGSDLRVQVKEQLLREDENGFDIIMKIGEDELARVTQKKPEEINGLEASFGPTLSGSLSKFMRTKLMGGEITKLLESNEQEHRGRSALVRILWGAQPDGDYVAPAGIRDPTKLPKITRGGRKFTEEQNVAVYCMSRDLNEVLIIDAAAGSGKTETIMEAALKWAEVHTKDDSVLLVSSTMNQPVAGLATKIKLDAPRHCRILVLQSVSFLANQSEEDSYHSLRLPAIIMKLARNPDSIWWARPVTDEEKRTLALALNVCSSLYAGFEMLWGNENMDATDEERKNALMMAVKVVMEVYKPKIVIGTINCIKRFTPVLQKIRVAILDEAGTVSQVNCVELVMTIPTLEKLALLGDSRQLLTKEVDLPAQLLPMGWESAFSVGNGPGAVNLALTRTFRFSERMVPILSDFAYDGKLSGGVPRPGLCKYFCWPYGAIPNDIIVINIDGKESFSATKSKGNVQQAKAALVLAEYFSVAHPNLSTVVLSFYKYQLQMNSTAATVIVESADKYQGSECDCVILTTTMEAADEKGNFGFAEDIKRINVALTRAKEGVIILANVTKLEASSSWHHLWEVLRRHNVTFYDKALIEHVEAHTESLKGAVQEQMELEEQIETMPLSPTPIPTLESVRMEAEMIQTPSPATLMSVLDLHSHQDVPAALIGPLQNAGHPGTSDAADDSRDQEGPGDAAGAVAANGVPARPSRKKRGGRK